MMRKNVKRAPPKAKGGMSSLTMYRSRTSDLTALLYHSHVDRPSRELLTVALVLAALAGLGGAAVGAAGVPDPPHPLREPAGPVPAARGRESPSSKPTASPLLLCGLSL